MNLPQPISRRHLLKSIAVGGPLLAAGGLQAASTKNAPTPAKEDQPSGWAYAHTIGSLKVFVLTDGALHFSPHPTFGGSMATEEEVKAVLRAHYRPTDRINAELNLCLIDDGKTRTLIDTGYGDRARSGAGLLTSSLKKAGYEPKDINRIILTHAHPDHAYGLTSKAGEPLFPNARVKIHAAEKVFWSKSEQELAAMKANEERLAGMIDNLNTIFNDLGDSLIENTANESIDSSLSLVDLPGHTPGHQGVMIESKGERLLVLGDAANNEILMTAQPDWPFGFDNDPDQTAKTRRGIFAKVADQRIPVLGYHWSIPGIAYIGRDAGVFRWHPTPIQASALSS